MKTRLALVAIVVGLILWALVPRDNGDREDRLVGYVDHDGIVFDPDAR